MKATFITLFFALSLPLGLFAAEDLHADSHISASADVEYTAVSYTHLTLPTKA